jgi:thiol-disulfide isomerase/thioredoxin
VLQGEDLQGKSISSTDLAGHVVVVNAWATWCAPCEQEQPALVHVAKRYADQGVRFLGINHMDQTAAAREWVRTYDVPYPSIADPSGRFAASFDYFGLPTRTSGLPGRCARSAERHDGDTTSGATRCSRVRQARRWQRPGRPV